MIITTKVVSELRRNEENNQFAGRYHQKKVINAIILFTREALDLRRLMSYHDMTISMERVGDLIEEHHFGVRRDGFVDAGI